MGRQIGDFTEEEIVQEMVDINRIADMINSKDEEMKSLGVIAAQSRWPELTPLTSGFNTEIWRSRLAFRAYSLGGATAILYQKKQRDGKVRDGKDNTNAGQY